MNKIVLLALILFSLSSFAVLSPDPNLTPGRLCTPSDADFRGYDYPERIARCQRDIMPEEKQLVAESYGNIPKTDWPKYEFDHLLPLCAGGANDIKNLWPEPIAEAHQKDILENDICLAMKAGTMTQAQAIEKVHNWFVSKLTTDPTPTMNEGLDPIGGDINVICKAKDAILITFKIGMRGIISHVAVKFASPDGEHEIVKYDGAISGTEINIRSPLLKTYLRYVLKQENKDRYELFLPSKVVKSSSVLIGYFKFSFEGNYPNLEEMTCHLKK